MRDYQQYAKNNSLPVKKYAFCDVKENCLEQF
jgi:hypothetical protein